MLLKVQVGFRVDSMWVQASALSKTSSSVHVAVSLFFLLIFSDKQSGFQFKPPAF